MNLTQWWIVIGLGSVCLLYLAGAIFAARCWWLAVRERHQREGELCEAWWNLRWHVARIFWGNPMWFLAAFFDGLKAFRREFARTFGNRWRAKDRAEFRREAGEG